MERSNFIKLLEEYRDKAIMEARKESKVQAALLITPEFKAAINELERMCCTVNAGLEKVAGEFKNIYKSNNLSEYNGSFYYSSASTQIFENIISSLSEKIRKGSAYQQTESEIRNKFDAAIKAAKATRSPAKLKELADALGIETPSIEVGSTPVSQNVDTEFVKEKIKAVALLA